jgi:hypothetical protein
MKSSGDDGPNSGDDDPRARVGLVALSVIA